MLKIFSQLPIRVKLLSSSILTLILISLFIFSYYPVQQKKQVQNALENKVLSMAEMFALSTGIALGLDNFSAITEAMDWAKRDSSLAYIVLIDTSGEVFATYNPDSVEINIAELIKGREIVENQGMLHSVVPMRYLDLDYGTLLLGYSLKEMHTNISRNTTTTLYISLFILLVGIIISLAFSHMITRPIIKLRNAAKELGEGNYDVDVDVTTFDEVGVLGNVFRMMVNNIRQTMEALRQSEKKLSDITSTIGEGVCVLDENGLLTFVNPEAENLLGWKEDELLGKKINEVIYHPSPNGSDNEGKDDPLLKVIKEGKVYKNHDDIFITKDKTEISVAYVFTPIKDDGEIIGSVIAFHNIKERKDFVEALRKSEEKYRMLSEQLTEANSMKDLLLDIITHDLKNPAGVISGMSEIIVSEMPGNEMVTAVKESSDNLLKVINNATTLAKLTMGEEIEKKPLDMIEVIKQSVDEFKHALKSSEMSVEFQLPDQLIIEANPIIAEVFKNFISNALKYAMEGKKLVIQAQEEHDEITISVRDFGKTIPEEDRERIFIRRTQLEKGVKRGRGLGLAIVKRIAEVHNAEVGVKPNEPSGNQFFLKIHVEGKE